MEAYVARQPIFNRSLKIFGYELLFRDSIDTFMLDIDGDQATNTVLSNSLFAIGLKSLLSGKKAFINFTQNMLIARLPLLLPKETMVIEVLEDVKPIPELVEACREMSEKGYTIALDDFTYTDELLPLIALANIIKFDFQLTSMNTIQFFLEKIPRENGIWMLAEKIETYEEFKHATDMGFEFFQGYFFCKPELMSGKKITGSQLSLLRIVAEVNKADVNVDIIETLVTPDVSLSYKLLRYINSAFFTKANPIESIKQALVYMGENEIRRFISLVAMDDLAADKPPELARTACIRGKFCELIARESALKPSVNELFTLGIFSLIDAIVDQPMPKVMEELPLSERIKQALVRRQGDLTVILVLVETYEKGDWTHVAQLVKLLKINQNTLPSLYLQACRWSTKLLDAKHASDE